MTASTTGFSRFAGLIFSSCLALLLIPAQAQADAIPPLTITVLGTQYAVQYDVQFFNNTSFDTRSGELLTTPWWGDAAKAIAFRNAYKLAAAGSPILFDLVSGNFNPPANLDFLLFVSAINPLNSEIINTAYLSDQRITYETNSLIRENRFYYALAVESPSAVPEINAGSLAQALLILFALWLVTRRRVGAGVASAVPLLRADAAPPILRVSYTRHWQSLGVMRLLCSWKDAQ
jgi:hypothetical protein